MKSTTENMHIYFSPSQIHKAKHLEKHVNLICKIGGKMGLECSISNIPVIHTNYEKIVTLIGLINQTDINIFATDFNENLNLLVTYIINMKALVCADQCEIINSILIHFFQNELNNMQQRYTLNPDFEEKILCLFTQALIESHATNAINSPLWINKNKRLIDTRSPFPSTVPLFIDSIKCNQFCFNLWQDYFMQYNYTEIRSYFYWLRKHILNHPQHTDILFNISRFITQFKEIPKNKDLSGINIMLDTCIELSPPLRPKINMNLNHSEEKTNDASVSAAFPRTTDEFAIHHSEMSLHLEKAICHSKHNITEYQCSVTIFKDYLIAKIHHYDTPDNKLRLIYAAEKQLLNALEKHPTDRLHLLKRYLGIIEERIHYEVPQALSLDFNHLIACYTVKNATTKQTHKLAFLRALLTEANLNPEKSYKDCISSTLNATAPYEPAKGLKKNKGLWSNGMFGQHRTNDFLNRLQALDEREQASYNQGL